MRRRSPPRKPSIGQSTAIRSVAGSRPLSCDMRIAFENAQFAAPEIKLGWIGGGAMKLSSRMLSARQRSTHDAFIVSL